MKGRWVVGSRSVSKLVCEVYRCSSCGINRKEEEDIGIDVDDFDGCDDDLASVCISRNSLRTDRARQVVFLANE